jgi:hypothetical protein
MRLIETDEVSCWLDPERPVTRTRHNIKCAVLEYVLGVQHVASRRYAPAAAAAD